jgi:dTDP-4-dehydrorhamnose reductase
MAFVCAEGARGRSKRITENKIPSVANSTSGTTIVRMSWVVMRYAVVMINQVFLIATRVLRMVGY